MNEAEVRAAVQEALQQSNSTASGRPSYASIKEEDIDRHVTLRWGPTVVRANVHLLNELMDTQDVNRRPLDIFAVLGGAALEGPHLGMHAMDGLPWGVVRLRDGRLYSTNSSFVIDRCHMDSIFMVSDGDPVDAVPHPRDAYTALTDNSVTTVDAYGRGIVQPRWIPLDVLSPPSSDMLLDAIWPAQSRQIQMVMYVFVKVGAL